MAKLLHLQASPREGSYSTRVAAAFLDSYRRERPEDRVETLDLFQAEVPLFTAPEAKAKYAVMSGEKPRDKVDAAWRAVIQTIEHFKQFDKYVLSCPMWNFNVPYRLKQYLDVIVQPSLTFTYSSEKGYQGLVTGRPLMLILARGGIYPAGDPRQTFDFQETYLRSIFGFIGFSDIRVIRIEGTLQDQPEQIEAAVRRAIAAAIAAGLENST
ncbi:MAG: NAD(P)H-dependent oxidoreductase [Pirellulales bacterium]|nr:NAD(P)H-dependent oxidoreductase [Pirellulales bacterium]